MKNFDYYAASDAATAVEVLKSVKGARLKGGGTDLVSLLKDGITRPPALVNLLSAPGLSGIQKTGDRKIRIGATTTIHDVDVNPDLRQRATAVADAANQTATPLLRNRATVGGNLCQRPRCWYFRHPAYPCSKKGGETCYAAEGENKYHAIFDNVTCNIVHPSNLAPALWAFDAEIAVQGPKGSKSIPISDFWVRPEEDIKTEIVLDPDEVVTEVTLTLPEGKSGSAYVEVREKQSYDWALANCACRLDMDGATIKDLRIIVSAVAPVPLRKENAEAILRGKPFSEDLAWKAGQAAVEGATPLRDNAYKIPMLKACVAHTLIAAAKRASA
jgi:xanthine dehydrogenase YagS FAD-binding subunit